MAVTRATPGLVEAPRTTGPGAATPASPNRSSSLLTVNTGFTQLSAAEATVPQGAPNLVPGMRLLQGVDPQRAFSSALTTGTTGSATTPPFVAAAPAAASGNTSGNGNVIIPNTSSNGGATSASNSTGGSEEIQQVKDYLQELKDSGEPGDDDELYAVAIYMKSWQDKNLQKEFDRKRKETKEYMARVDAQMNGEDLPVQSQF